MSPIDWWEVGVTVFLLVVVPGAVVVWGMYLVASADKRPDDDIDVRRW
jgi:hypothetical protein